MGGQSSKSISYPTTFNATWDGNGNEHKCISAIISTNESKWISAIIGVAVLGSSFLVGYVQGNLLDVTIKVVNLVVAPLFVLFFMAIFSPVSSDRGAVAGGLAALAAAIGVSFFGLFGFVQTWNLFVALVVGIPVGIAVSFLDKHRMIQRNRDL